jgi:hypothetical protein
LQAQKYLSDARFELSRGLNDLAENCFKQALAEARAANDSCSGGEALRGLAKIYEVKGDYKAMLNHSAEAISADTHFWGPDSAQIAECKELCGRASVCLRDYDCARIFLEEALELKRNFFDGMHAEVLLIVRELLVVDIDTNMIKDTADTHALMLETYQRLGDGQSWIAFLKLDRIVDWYLQQQRPADAERVLKSELDMLLAHFPLRKEEIAQVTAVYRTQLESNNKGLAASRLRTQDMSEETATANLAAKAKQFENSGQNKEAQAAYELLVAKLKSSDKAENAEVAQAIDTYSKRAEKQEEDSDWRNKAGAAAKKVLEGDKIRAELPAFLDAFNALISTGLFWQQAISKLAESNNPAFPTLCPELLEADRELKVFRKPLQQSLREIAERYGVDELSALAATLSGADQSKASIARALRMQSEAIKEKVKSKKKTEAGVKKAFKWF